tara:strand:+ start:75 stop:377 length:303 start_codon:yes stop_codon:yes gene_type:complete
MAISRYASAAKLPGLKMYGTTHLATKIRQGVDSGEIKYTTYILKEDERLDQISGLSYGTSSYWWAIAAASGIGWGLQVPAGTLLKIPAMGTITALIFSKV